MESLIARNIIAMLMLPVMACAQARRTSPSPLQDRQSNETAAEVSFGDQAETLASTLERSGRGRIPRRGAATLVSHVPRCVGAGRAPRQA